MIIVPFQTVNTSKKDLTYTITVEVNCPHCIERTGFEGLIKFTGLATAMNERVIFETRDYCPLCAAGFEEAIHPGVKTLRQWLQREEMLLDRDIKDCHYEETHRYIPEDCRQSEKKSRKRKDVKTSIDRSNYLIEGYQ